MKCSCEHCDSEHEHPSTQTCAFYNDPKSNGICGLNFNTKLKKRVKERLLQMRRRRAHDKMSMKQDSFTKMMINKLKRKIESKFSQLLTLHGVQEEVDLALSDHQTENAQNQGRRLVKALGCVSDACCEGSNIAWRDAGKKASDALLSEVWGRTIERWLTVCKDDKHKLPTS